MNSDFHFQLRGGGISIPRMYSELQYLIFGGPDYNGVQFNNKRYSSWCKKHQYYLPAKKYSKEYLKKILLELKNDF